MSLQKILMIELVAVYSAPIPICTIYDNLSKFTFLLFSGLPPVKGDDIGRGNARTPLELWKQAFTAVFPQEVKTELWSYLIWMKSLYFLFCFIQIVIEMFFWLSFVFSFFKQAVEKEMAADPSKDPQYRESAVDNVRAQKDKVILKWRQAVDAVQNWSPLHGVM